MANYQGVGKMFQEGLLVAIDKDLQPEKDMTSIIGTVVLATLRSVFEEVPLKLHGEMRVLIPNELPSNPAMVESGIDYDGNITILLPADQRNIVQQPRVNAHFLQIVSASASLVEGIRRNPNATTDVLERYKQLGFDACGRFLEQTADITRAKGVEVALNTAIEPPETIGYAFNNVFGIQKSSKNS